MTEETKTLKPFVEILEIGNPIGHQNLTLVPLRGEENEQMDYILAADAIEDNKLTVTERRSRSATGVVGKLRRCITLSGGDPWRGSGHQR